MPDHVGAETVGAFEGKVYMSVDVVWLRILTSGVSLLFPDGGRGYSKDKRGNYSEGGRVSY
jgi:hypothetical protein